jgi:ubiquinone/menaquinone biosynthesis C-methylase UbiE
LALILTLNKYMPRRAGRVLEIGSGSGRTTRVLLQSGFSNIIATDIDPWAQSQAPQGIDFVLQDSANSALPAHDESVAAVLMVHVIEHLTNPDFLLTEVRRVLCRNGVAVVVTPDFSRAYKDFYEDRTHVHPYVAKSLLDALSANGLGVLKLTHTNVRQPFGRLPFLWRRVPWLVFTGNALLAVAGR